METTDDIIDYMVLQWCRCWWSRWMIKMMIGRDLDCNLGIARSWYNIFIVYTATLLCGVHDLKDKTYSHVHVGGDHLPSFPLLFLMVVTSNPSWILAEDWNREYLDLVRMGIRYQCCHQCCHRCCHRCCHHSCHHSQTQLKPQSVFLLQPGWFHPRILGIRQELLSMPLQLLVG